MLTVSELFIYPVKSLAGIAVTSARLADTGFSYDRHWMLVDDNNRFISQREIPLLALLQPSFTEQGIRVQHKHNKKEFTIPYRSQKTEPMTVALWEDVSTAMPVSNEANKWFSDILSLPCKLVFIPGEVKRKVDQNYASRNEITAFSDGFPLLLIGQASLDDLNCRLVEPLPMNRFRPNIVYVGGAPFEEDMIEQFAVNNIYFYPVKPCARCAITTTNQDTAERSKEPLATLATFRRKGNNVYFGQNVLFEGHGEISVGDQMLVLKRRSDSFLNQVS